MGTILLPNCDCCPEGCVCPECFDVFNGPFTCAWDLTVSGLKNGTCPNCEAFNGSWLLSPLPAPSCGWFVVVTRTAQGVSQSWELAHFSQNDYLLLFNNIDCGLTNFGARFPLNSLDPCNPTPVTAPLTGTADGCSIAGAVATITPHTPPSLCCNVPSQLHLVVTPTPSGNRCWNGTPFTVTLNYDVNCPATGPFDNPTQDSWWGYVFCDPCYWVFQVYREMGGCLDWGLCVFPSTQPLCPKGHSGCDGFNEYTALCASPVPATCNPFSATWMNKQIQGSGGGGICNLCAPSGVTSQAFQSLELML